MTKRLHGRLFLLGTGLFLAAEAVGGTLHKLDNWQLLASYTEAKGDLCHQIAEESMECWAAMTICFCAVAVWQTSRQPAGLIATRRLRATVARRKQSASMPAASLMVGQEGIGPRTDAVRLTARRRETEAERSESDEYAPVGVEAEPGSRT